MNVVAFPSKTFCSSVLYKLISIHRESYFCWTGISFVEGEKRLPGEGFVDIYSPCHVRSELLHHLLLTKTKTSQHQLGFCIQTSKMSCFRTSLHVENANACCCACHDSKLWWFRISAEDLFDSLKYIYHFTLKFHLSDHVTKVVSWLARPNFLDESFLDRVNT